MLDMAVGARAQLRSLADFHVATKPFANNLSATDDGNVDELNESEGWNLTMEEFLKGSFYIIQPLICITGLIGNAMTFLIIHLSGKLTKFVSHVYLRFLAVLSSLFLIVHLIIYVSSLLQQSSNVYTQNNVACKLLTFLGGFGDLSCMWLIVFISADRLLLIYKPEVRNRLCTVGNVRSVSYMILLCSGLASSWILIVAHPETVRTLPNTNGGVATNEQVCGLNSDYLRVYEVSIILETAMSIVIPSLLVIIVNSAIIVKLKIFHSNRIEQLKKNDLESGRTYSSTVYSYNHLNQHAAAANANNANQQGTNHHHLTPNHDKNVMIPLTAIEGEYDDPEQDGEEGVIEIVLNNNNKTTNENKSHHKKGALLLKGGGEECWTDEEEAANLSDPIKENESSAEDGNSTTNNYQPQQDNNNKGDMGLTSTILQATSVFVALNLPSYIVRLLMPHLAPNISKSVQLTIWYISYLLYYCHHGSLFFIYTFNSQQMRKELRPAFEVVCCAFCPPPEGVLPELSETPHAHQT